MSLIRKHGAVLQAWACLALVSNCSSCCKMNVNSLTLSVAARMTECVTGKAYVLYAIFSRPWVILQGQLNPLS